MSAMDIEKAVFDLPRGPGLASAASLCMRESSVRGDIGNKSLVLPELVLQKKEGTGFLEGDSGDLTGSEWEREREGTGLEKVHEAGTPEAQLHHVNLLPTRLLAFRCHF